METGESWLPWRLVDRHGVAVGAVDAYFADLLARGRAVSTVRSYGMDLLGWFRFLWSVEVSWERATRAEARDFVRRLRLVVKPGAGRVGSKGPAPGAVNGVTGKPAPGVGYAASTRAHAETVVRCFYEFHRDVGGGPIINPFPKVRPVRGGRAHAHHNPMEPWREERVGLYRPKVPRRIPRSIPDELFNALFAALPSHRDRALVAFYVSTGARAAELLGATRGDIDPGERLVTVVRKGTGVCQPLPASPDAFVWLRLYQEQVKGLVPGGRGQPLWWTLRPPARPLSYHAAYAMFRRVNVALGTNWTLHDLRHTAAYRMARDPKVALTDVQWVLGHAHLSTTQLYLTPRVEEVINNVQAHHARRSRRDDTREQPVPAEGYRSDVLDVLFSGQRP